MNRAILVIGAALVLASRVVALEIESFAMSDYEVVFKHYPGGIRLSTAKKRLKATVVTPAGFYAKRFGQLHAVDLLIDDGKVVVGDIFGRKVMAVHRDGKVRIFPNYVAALFWGKPVYAAAGMNLPPEPRRVCPRQFWAVKRDNFYVIKLKGSARACLRIARKWGFEQTIFFDGGSTLTNKFTPAIAAVVKKS